MSFEDFYEYFYPRACSYVSKKIQNRHDAEDLVCDVFLYCYDHYAEYDPKKASPGTWLYLILNSRIKNFYRDRKQLVALELVDEFVNAEDPRLDQALELDDMRRALAEALKSLPERQREIVICRYFMEYSTAETAQSVGISEGNVRTQLTRALAKIRQIIEPPDHWI